MKRKKLIIGCALIAFLILNTSTSMAYSIDLNASKSQITQSNNILNYPNYASGDWYFKPDNYNELVNWYQNLESQYPNYIEVFKANEVYNTGKVAGDYDLYYVRITNESLGFHKPEVLFLGSPHGDETAGTIGLYWFTDWLMRKAFTDEMCADYSKDWLRWLVDNREIYFEVSHNPYGFDQIQRYDAHGWDLNREADYDGPGSPTGGIWGSVSGKTLVRFVNNHTIRVGCDFHGGVRMLIYPWASTYNGVNEESLITGRSYKSVPPDFYYFDAASLRLGDYIGDFGGDLNENNVGTVREHINYLVKGGLTPWGYASDVIKHPLEDPYVKDEKFGNYPGSGIFWVTPEMSVVKNPWEINFGNDSVDGFGPEVRRFILHQTDLAQPYIRWLKPLGKNEVTIKTGESLDVSWQVNGSLVVDHTSVQWGTNPDPIEKYDWISKDYNEHTGQPLGGTGWDNAENGKTQGITYSEEISFDTAGEYYIVAKAQVDQMYSNVIRPEIYGSNSYLRIIQERTNESYMEVIDGSDGIERINGRSWWYSQIIHVVVRNNTAPMKPKIQGPRIGEINKKQSFSITVEDPEHDEVYITINWGDGNQTDWIGPFESGEEIIQSHTYSKKGMYSVKVKAKDIFDDESSYSTYLVQMQKAKHKTIHPFFDIAKNFLFSLFEYLV